MKLKPAPGSNSIPTSIAARALESSPVSDAGLDTGSISFDTGDNNILRESENLLQFGLGDR
jgi:hypothetical protein